jgi:hypothetical protein
MLEQPKPMKDALIYGKREIILLLLVVKIAIKLQ